MKAIFTHLNILSNSDSSRGIPVSFLVINNSDGSPRWICNANTKKPLFLHFYMVSSWRSWLFSFLIKAVFFLRIQKLVFKTETAVIKPSNQQDNPIVDFFSDNWALFTGTVGPNNKILLVEEKTDSTFFYKVAHTPQALRLIENEVTTIKKLDELQMQSFVFPKTEKKNALAIQLEDISTFGEREGTFTSSHINALQEIYQKTHQEAQLASLPIINKSLNKLQGLENSNDVRIPKGLIRKLRLLASSINLEMVETALCHGDFTPWNMYAGKDKLAVYDWEMAQENIPVGFDAFHFIIQQGILVDRKSWTQIRSDIDAQINSFVFPKWHIKREAAIDQYLKWYLFINTINYLDIYAKQAEWHTQVTWLVCTWNQALSDILQNEKAPRNLVIMDVFDIMHPKNYAAIKFPNDLPDTLSVYSDIDLCVEKQDVDEVVNYLKSHPLTHHVNVDKRSHMLSIQIYLVDASVLSLDLIWSLTRKSLVMLDASEVLNNVVENNFGVKRMRALDTARYIALFYGLNGANIPQKYSVYELVVSNGKSALDKLIHHCYLSTHCKKEKLSAYLRLQPNNTFLKRQVHAINYFIDSVKSVIFSKGLTITFSGVDGAGKSTIIENVRHEIEKKLRKKVIVLRHRPSLLPILSAITKGKAQAEKDAASTLPRQGSNKSSISSALRFGYYYIDYIIGQYYVYFKYVRRGYVVLYDRYYFDFINDSKRSNIELPKSLIRAAYFFVLAPDLNFFLFADPEVILKRKQELDPLTITKLTTAYLELFEDLNTREVKYFSIENVELKNTMNIIMNKTLAEVA